jgi:hypothetical protein
MVALSVVQLIDISSELLNVVPETGEMVGVETVCITV